MGKRLLLAKDLLFLVGLAFLLSKMLQTVVLTHVFGHSPPISGQEPQRELKEQAETPLRDYDAICRRNIFNSESGEDETRDALKPDASAEPVEDSDLNVVLLGTAVGPPGDTFAVIEDLESREQGLYQVGDTVQEDAEIVKVSRCRVVLSREGSREALECIEPDERPPRPSRRVVRHTQRGQGGGIRQVAKNRYWIDEERVASALANMNRLMTQIRVVPNLRGGSNQGWKVFAIRPNSIFAQIGLKNGDVIQRINGRELRTPTKAFEAFQDLRSARHLEVDVIRRGGRQQTLHYEIR